MKAKIRSYYVFSLYGGMRGAEGAFVGSAIFAIFWILGPLFILGLTNEMTQYVFSRTIVVIVPALIFVGVLASLIPSVIGGVLLSGLLHNDLLADTKHQIITMKGSFVGALIGFLLLWTMWTFDPLNPPISIDRNLFIYYSITGIFSAAIGGSWTARKLAKDSSYALKENRGTQ